MGGTKSMEGFEKELETALALVKSAGELTLQYFGKDIAVETKADNSPVTVADRGAEALIREGLGSAFPEDGILGEEVGEIDIKVIIKLRLILVLANS